MGQGQGRKEKWQTGTKAQTQAECCRQGEDFGGSQGTLEEGQGCGKEQALSCRPNGRGAAKE
jgi:hypothetical protein